MSYVYEVKNVLPADYCKHLIDKFEKNDYKRRGICGSDENTIKRNIKMSTDLDIFSDPSFESEVDYISKVINPHISDFFRKFDKNIKNYHTTTASSINKPYSPWIQIQRTEKGEYFEWHSDYSTEVDRRLAFILYLNTLDENDGGETEFMDGKIVRPEVSKLIIFPSTWTNYHRGKEVLGKTKYILTGFVCHTEREETIGKNIYKNVVKNRMEGKSNHKRFFGDKASMLW